MAAITNPLVWCVIQITLVGLLAWTLCVALRRWSAPGNAAVPAAALAAIVLLTFVAFLPIPGTWRFGMNLQRWQQVTGAVSPPAWPRAESPTPAGKVNAEKATTPPPGLEPEAVAALPAEAVSPELPADTANAPPAQGRFVLPRWFGRALAGLVAVGIGAGLLQLFGGLLSIRACRRTSQRVDDPELQELLDVLQAELCLTRPVELRESQRLATAATIGWWRPVILLPASWRDWTSDQRRAVLAHELAHVAGSDYVGCILAQLGLALHFYHPLVHWLVARLRLEQELAADATAAGLVGGQRAYLTTLAELALHSQERSLGWPAHTFLPTPGTFLRRIEMLRDSKTSLPASPRRRWLVKWAAVGLLLAGAALIAGVRGGPDASPFDREVAAQNRPGGTAASVGGVDLTHVTNDAKLLVALRPAEALALEEIRSALGKVGAGPSPLKLLMLERLQQATVIGPAGIDLNNPDDAMIVVLQFSQPTTIDDLAKTGSLPPDLKPLPAAPGADGAAGRQFAYGTPNDKTIAVGRSDALSKYLANRRKGKPAIAAGEAWQKVQKGTIVAALDMEAVRDLMQQHEPPREVAAQIDALSPLWKDSEYLAAGIILEGKAVHFRAVATCDNTDLAGDVAETAQAAITLARNSLRSLREREQNPPALALLALQTAEGLLKTMKVERSEALVVAQTSTTVPEVKTVAEGGLVDAVTQARAEARRQVSMNNLKQIMLAMHNWAGVHGGRFPPPVIYGKDGKGKVPHSWRVELLPYLEQAALYEAYNFDESWDSEANKMVLAKMPALLRHPMDKEDSTSSGYYVLTPDMLVEAAGERPLPTAFSKREGVRFADIQDGTSNTLAVVEAKRDIPWTRPDDIVYDPEKAPPTLGGFFKEGFNAALCDGSVRFISSKIEPGVLKILISPQGAEPAPPIP